MNKEERAKKEQEEAEAKERFEAANRKLRRKYDTMRLWSEKPWLIPECKWEE